MTLCRARSSTPHPAAQLACFTEPGASQCGCPIPKAYVILYVPEEVGYEDHDVFRVAGELRRNP